MMSAAFYRIIPFLLASVIFSGCKKFLDTEPEGRLVLSKVQDYNLLLNGAGLSAGDYNIADLMSDDMDLLNVERSNPSIGMRIYLWADQFDFNISESPKFWGAHYANIYGYNVVVNEIDNAVAGTLPEKRKLKAEAIMRRAFEYLWLVNLYAKPYHPLTSGSDLAIPDVTSVDIADQSPPRATVSVIYQKIIKDLLLAIPDLPANNNNNKFRGSVNAAYSILARTYYYMNNYTEASKYAYLALSDPGTSLLDYNNIKNINELPLISISKQEIYARNSNKSNNIISGIISTDLIDLLKSEDLRLKFFYAIPGISGGPLRGSIAFFASSPGKVNFGTSVPEMKLIIAEAAARIGNLQLALQQLNDIRKARTVSTLYFEFNSSEPEAVLQRILKERRLEFAFRGLRWMDMRKLDVENRMPAVVRLDFEGKVITTLEPHSSKYILKVPASVLTFNPGMLQN